MATSANELEQLLSTPPSLSGFIVRAFDRHNLELESVVLHIQPQDYDLSRCGNLDCLNSAGEQDFESGVVLFFGREGILGPHGFERAEHVIGKHCKVWTDGRYEVLAIEPEEGTSDWPQIVWTVWR